MSEEFSGLHPYPDVYYEENEFGGLDEAEYCYCCENTEDECECTQHCIDGFHWSIWDEEPLSKLDEVKKRE